MSEPKKIPAEPADELTAAEAELHAAQQRYDAARRAVAEAKADAPLSEEDGTGDDDSAGEAPAGAGGESPQPPVAPPGPEASSSRTASWGSDPQAAAAAEPYYATTYAASSKDHVAAGLLAIFLGALGIHKFYLGYTNTGFIMLAVSIIGSLVTFSLAFFVMAVIGIVEGILYLTKTQSEFEQIYVNRRREWF